MILDCAPVMNYQCSQGFITPMSIRLSGASSLPASPYRATFILTSTIFFGTVVGGFVYSLVQYGRLPSVALEYLSQADEWLRTGQTLRAVAAYRTAAIVAPDDDRALLKLGLAAYEAGLSGEAKEALRKVIAIRPTQASAYYLLGLIELKDGAFDEAIRLNQAAIRLRPDYAEAYTNLGTAWLRKGHPEKAIPSYQHALQINPFLEAARKSLDALQSGS